GIGGGLGARVGRLPPPRPRRSAPPLPSSVPSSGRGRALFERLYPVIAEQPWMLRGLIWMLAIFSIEYATGWLIREAVGQSPWNYTGAPLAVGELIRLDYAPAWFLLGRSEEHTSELQSRENLVCRLLLEKK